jgi:hypothetical protein
MRAPRQAPPITTGRTYQPWTKEENEQLRLGMAEGRTPTAIGTAFQRTARSIRRRAEILKLSWRKGEDGGRLTLAKSSGRSA